MSCVLEMCRHKLWMYLTLSDVEICKAKEDSIKKMIKEYQEMEGDLRLIHSLLDQVRDLVLEEDNCKKVYVKVSKLNCPHKELDDSLKTLLGSLTKQVSGRQVNIREYFSLIDIWHRLLSLAMAPIFSLISTQAMGQRQ